jgi:hypothetical protein
VHTWSPLKPKVVAGRRSQQGPWHGAVAYASKHVSRTSTLRAQIVLKLLATRYGELSAEAVASVQGASTADLDAIAQRALTAQTLDEALGTG